MLVSSFFGVVLCCAMVRQCRDCGQGIHQRRGTIDSGGRKVQSAVSATKPVSFGSTSKESDRAVSSHGRSTTDVLKPVRIAQVASVIVGRWEGKNPFTAVPFESKLHYRSS
jgi:hypothetical protein